jgi:hypothetical protein
VLEGPIDMIVGIIAPRIVADPSVVVVDMRGFGVIGLIAERGARVFLAASFSATIFGRSIFLGAIFRTARPGISRGRWTVRGHVTATNVAGSTALLGLALCLALRSGIAGE